MADLLTLIPKSVVGDWRENLVVLDRFYIPTRYPDAIPGSLEDGMPSYSDAEEALAIAGKILEEIEKIV
jgi:HEPN domain-containing protein